MLFQQGDVLFESVDNLPIEAKEVPPLNGKHVFAYGEATGHSHATLTDNVALFMMNDEMFCKATSPFSVIHEEHQSINIPSGNYAVRKVKEYI